MTDLGHTDLRTAFEAFYAAERAGVARALTFTIGDPDLAVEATDEAMTRAYQRWGRVGTMDNPGGWVYRVGLNWARSVLRRCRRPVRPLYEDATTDIPPIADPAVHAALAELDVKHRSVVVCRHLLDWSVEETAAALGIRPGTVKSRLSRASDQLARRLHHLRPTAPSTPEEDPR